MYRLTHVIHHIHARLRDRLPFAPITPLGAVEVLSGEHPCADSGVGAHLVGCVEGNGIRLPLASVMAIFRVGYRDRRAFTATATNTDISIIDTYGSSDVTGGISNSDGGGGGERSSGGSVDHCRTAITQWGPMEETLFTALYINLRRRTQRNEEQNEQKQQQEQHQQQQDSLWNDLLEKDYCEKKLHEVCNAEELFNHLCEKLRVLVDVANFVHYSTLTLRPRRLELLAGVLKPLVHDIASEWSHIKERILPQSLTLMPQQEELEEEEEEEDDHDHLWLLQLYKLGSLAGKCLRLYGRCFTVFHSLFCEIVFSGAAASRLLLHKPLKHGGECFRARVACDVLAGTSPLFLGFLTHTVDEMQRWTGPVSQWLQLVVEITEYLARDVMATASHINSLTSDTPLDRIEPEYHTCCVQVLHTLSMLLALYQRSYSHAKDTIHRSGKEVVLLQRGLHTMRCLLQSFLLTTTKTTAGTTGEGSMLRCVAILTVGEWGKCCEAVEVLRTLSELLQENIATHVDVKDGVTRCKDAEIRLALLVDALSFFTTGNSISGSISNTMHTPSVLPLSFYLTLVKCMQMWQLSSTDTEQKQREYCSLRHALWNAICTSFPSLFDGFHQPNPPAWSLLELLESLDYRTVKMGPSDPHQNNNNNHHRHHHYQYEQQHQQLRSMCLARIHHELQPLTSKENPQLLRALLHAGSVATHPPLAGCLRRLLLPLAPSIQQLSSSSHTHLYAKDSSFTVDHNGVEDCSILAGGACGFLCVACQRCVVWDRPVGSPVWGCRCVLQNCNAANTLTAHVELLTPLLQQEEDSCMSMYHHREKSPLAVLRCIYTLAAGKKLQSEFAVDGEKTIPSRDSPVSLFFVECHAQLLLFPSSDVLPSHVCRILRLIFTLTPQVIVHVREFPQLLLRRLLFPARAITTATPFIGNANTDISDVVESAEPCELWEMFLWTCAVTVAHLGRRSILDVCDRDDDWYSDSTETMNFAARMRDNDDSEDEDAEHIRRLLSSMTGRDEISDLFVSVQQRVVRRALQLLS